MKLCASLPLALGLCAAASVCQAQEDNDASEVRDLVDQMLEFARAQDSAGVSELLHPSFLAKIEPEGWLMDRDAFTEFISTDPPPEEMQFEEGEVTVMGDLALCYERAAVAGLCGPARNSVAFRLAEPVADLTPMPTTSFAVADAPDDVVELGFGPAYLAVNCDVTDGDKTYRAREIALAAYDAERNEWRIFAWAEAPLD